MAELPGFKEARRIYQDVRKQTDEASDRLGKPFPLDNSHPPASADIFTRDTGELLSDKIYKKYRDDDRSLNYVEPADPKNYGR